MDDEPSNRKKRHRKRQGWEFTFFGGTSEKLDEGGNQAKLAPELAQSSIKQVFPLSTTHVGERVVITQILSGKSMIHRLSKMGLNKGSEIRVISKTKSGSVIVCLQDEQIGLGVGMAERVMVALAVDRI
ncbi:MAG: FeoA family protein [Xenococcaceae cyanobacterium MO_188.B32]|nr:FeoA family protein [Xenococcaceae cyanobacterium MO_188.B32]